MMADVWPLTNGNRRIRDCWACKLLFVSFVLWNLWFYFRHSDVQDRFIIGFHSLWKTGSDKIYDRTWIENLVIQESLIIFSLQFWNNHDRSDNNDHWMCWQFKKFDFFILKHSNPSNYRLISGSFVWKVTWCYCVVGFISYFTLLSPDKLFLFLVLFVKLESLPCTVVVVLHNVKQ